MGRPASEEDNGVMSDPKPAARRRHLMDPDNPRPAPSGSMSLSQVQKWVMSVLVVTTILHLVVGLVAPRRWWTTTASTRRSGCC